MKKKKYFKPLVETEDALEQTSLACNAVDGAEPEPKGGNFSEKVRCETILFYMDPLCGRDIIILLS